jgi:hypothetical protein
VEEQEGGTSWTWTDPRQQPLIAVSSQRLAKDHLRLPGGPIACGEARLTIRQASAGGESLALNDNKILPWGSLGCRERLV